MSRRRIIVAACAAVLLAVGTAACTAPQQSAERIIEDRLDPGSDVQINEEGDYELGTGKLPADWPSDIPAPSGFTVTQAFTDTGANSVIGTFVATGDQSSAVNDFISTLESEGWKFAPDSSITAGWFGKKDERYLNVASQVGSETYITIVSG